MPTAPFALAAAAAKTPREASVPTAAARPAVPAPWERCERRCAAKAGSAVERLRPRDLGPSTREKTGTKWSTGRQSTGPAARHRLDEVASRLVACLRAVRCVRVGGSRRGQVAVPRGERAPPSPPWRNGGQEQGEQERDPHACARCTVRALKPRGRIARLTSDETTADRRAH